jgi:hypothetical protein
MQTLLLADEAARCAQVVTTIGTIVFGLWLASKVLGGGDDGKSGR